MATAITALANLTLGSSASSVTFSSISGSYRDLILIVNAKNTTADTTLRITFNGDSATNYGHVLVQGNGSTASSTSNGTLAYALVGANNLADSNQTIQILDYSATDKNKTVLGRSSAPGAVVNMTANRWASTAAITTIAVVPGGNQFASGSTFALYGVASS